LLNTNINNNIIVCSIDRIFRSDIETD